MHGSRQKVPCRNCGARSPWTSGQRAGFDAIPLDLARDAYARVPRGQPKICDLRRRGEQPRFARTDLGKILHPGAEFAGESVGIKEIQERTARSQMAPRTV